MSAATHEVRGYSLGFEGLENSGITRYDAIKSLFDLPVALFLLFISAPVVLLAMLVVRLTSRGPAIYTQKRLGFGGRIFTIYKIRTMCLDSEPNGAQWSLPGDRRVTPVGRFLRWSHLDELPQLVNVLRGDMSLIGPRPERPEIVAQLEKGLPEYRLRLRVRPGVTGLAQVLQPPDTDMNSVRKKLTLDMYYIARMNPWLDIRIMIGTVLHILSVSKRLIARGLRFPDEHFDGGNLI